MQQAVWSRGGVLASSVRTLGTYLLLTYYQLKTILRHGTILSHENHTMFLSGSYLETQKPDEGHTNRKNIPPLSL
jgi:hypothetical protein